MVLDDIITLVEQKCDGRSLGSAKHKLWADVTRKKAVNTAVAAGFNGLYFLYKEAIVTGGSTAGEPRYELPDDFVDDLSVWYDGVPLIKGAGRVIDITAKEDIAGGYQPTWFDFRGLEINITPPPPDTGKEIRLFYNGKPESIVPETDSSAFTDYFLENFPDLHVYGMAEYALDYLGATKLAESFKNRYDEEISKMAMKNRQFWMRGVKIRLMNWDEFQAQKRYLFPQFGSVYRQQET